MISSNCFIWTILFFIYKNITPSSSVHDLDEVTERIFSGQLASCLFLFNWVLGKIWATSYPGWPPKGPFKRVLQLPWKTTWTFVLFRSYWFYMGFLQGCLPLKTSRNLSQNIPKSPRKMPLQHVPHTFPKILQECPPNPPKTCQKHSRKVKNIYVF